VDFFRYPKASYSRMLPKYHLKSNPPKNQRKFPSNFQNKKPKNKCKFHKFKGSQIKSKKVWYKSFTKKIHRNKKLLNRE
jgi:hypothetical protein